MTYLSSATCPPPDRTVQDGSEPWAIYLVAEWEKPYKGVFPGGRLGGVSSAGKDRSLPRAAVYTDLRDNQ